MSKKVFRPFWSYDVVKTEDWLSQMHAVDVIPFARAGRRAIARLKRAHKQYHIHRMALRA